MVVQFRLTYSKLGDDVVFQHWLLISVFWSQPSFRLFLLKQFSSDQIIYLLGRQKDFQILRLLQCQSLFPGSTVFVPKKVPRVVLSPQQSFRLFPFQWNFRLFGSPQFLSLFLSQCCFICFSPIFKRRPKRSCQTWGWNIDHQKTWSPWYNCDTEQDHVPGVRHISSSVPRHKKHPLDVLSLTPVSLTSSTHAYNYVESVAH